MKEVKKITVTIDGKEIAIPIDKAIQLHEQLYNFFGKPVSNPNEWLPETVDGLGIDTTCFSAYPIIPIEINCNKKTIDKIKSLVGRNSNKPSRQGRINIKIKY